jgi:inosose dehydratase
VLLEKRTESDISLTGIAVVSKSWLAFSKRNSLIKADKDPVVTSLFGFTGSEIGNKYPRDLAVLKKALDIRGIQICNAWFSAFLTTKPIEETIKAFIEHRDFLHALGAKMIGVAEQGHSIQGMMDVPVFDRKPVFIDQEWQKLAEGLEKLGELAAEKGMLH